MSKAVRAEPPLELIGPGSRSLHPHQRGFTLILVAYGALLCLLPGRLVVPGLGGAGRPATLFAVGLLVWWVMCLLLPTDAPRTFVPLRPAIYIYLIAFLAAMAAGYDRGLPPIESRAMDREFLITLGFIGVMLTITDGAKNISDIERILDWIVVLGAAGSIVGIIQFAGGPDLSQFRLPGLTNHTQLTGFGSRGFSSFLRVRGFANHPIEFGVVLASLLPVAISRATATARHRRLRFVAAGLIAAGIPLAVSRSAVLGLFVGMLILAIPWPWRRRANALAVGFVGIIAFQVIAPGLLGTLRSLFAGASTDDSVTGRTEDFAATASFISRRPWLGRGPGTFIPDRYRVIDNEYLGTVVDGGYVGLVALLLLLITGGVTAIRLSCQSRDSEIHDISAALGASIAVAVAVLATFDGLAFPLFSGILMIQLGCVGALDKLNRFDGVVKSVAERSPDRTLRRDVVLRDPSAGSTASDRRARSVSLRSTLP